MCLSLSVVESFQNIFFFYLQIVCIDEIQFPFPFHSIPFHNTFRAMRYAQFHLMSDPQLIHLGSV